MQDVIAPDDIEVAGGQVRRFDRRTNEVGRPARPLAFARAMPSSMAFAICRFPSPWRRAWRVAACSRPRRSPVEDPLAA